jgi:hypothetical protein
MFLGSDLGSETARLLGGEPGIWARMGKGLVWGGVIGALQWPVVRTAGVPSFRFLVASALGFAAGYPLGQTIQGFIVGQWTLHWTAYWSAVATFGLSLSVPQWWILRRHLKGASLWVLFSVAGWALSAAVWSGSRIDVVDSGVYGTLAGLGLVWLVRSQRPAAPAMGVQ